MCDGETKRDLQHIIYIVWTVLYGNNRNEWHEKACQYYKLANHIKRNENQTQKHLQSIQKQSKEERTSEHRERLGSIHFTKPVANLLYLVHSLSLCRSSILCCIYVANDKHRRRIKYSVYGISLHYFDSFQSAFDFNFVFYFEFVRIRPMGPRCRHIRHIFRFPIDHMSIFSGGIGYFVCVCVFVICLHLIS